MKFHAFHAWVRAALFAGTATAACAQLTLTNVAVYSGGELESGKHAGDTVSPITNDTTGNGLFLNPVGTGATYTSTVPTARDPVLHTFSTLAYNFDGAGYLSTNTAAATPATNNWGLEAWVNLSSTAGTQVFLVNGSGGDGYGLILANGTWQGLIGGTGYVDSGVAATTNTWTEIAFVDDLGVETFYVNGVAAATASFGGAAVPADMLALGSDFSGNYTHGLIDLARVFTFTGSFDPAALNTAAVPEPASCAALVGLGALGLVAWRRRGRS